MLLSRCLDSVYSLIYSGIVIQQKMPRKMDTSSAKLDTCPEMSLPDHHWWSILYLSGYTESPFTDYSPKA